MGPNFKLYSISLTFHSSIAAGITRLVIIVDIEMLNNGQPWHIGADDSLGQSRLALVLLLYSHIRKASIV